MITIETAKPTKRFKDLNEQDMFVIDSDIVPDSKRCLYVKLCDGAATNALCIAGHSVCSPTRSYFCGDDIIRPVSFVEPPDFKLKYNY